MAQHMLRFDGVVLAQRTEIRGNEGFSALRSADISGPAPVRETSPEFHRRAIVECAARRIGDDQTARFRQNRLIGHWG
jgi:hypothetical protein